MGDQAADIQGGLVAFITAQSAIALLDPPANGVFGSIVGAIQNGMASGVFPGAVEGQARPQVPAVEEQVAEAIGNAGIGTLGGSSCRGIAFIQGLDFSLLSGLSGMD